MFRTLTLLTALVVIAPGSASADARLERDVVPLAQSVRLDLDPARKDYAGSVRIEIDVRSAVDSFAIHAHEMMLTRVALEGRGATIELGARPRSFGAVSLAAPRTIARGRYTLAIDFSNDFNTRATSLYRLETGGASYAFTQFEAVDARGAFPCWDEPSFKIPWRLTLDVPATDVAVSNTPVESETLHGARRTVTFRETRPLPSYLLAIAVGPLDTVPIAGMSVPGRVVTVRGAGRLAAEAARMAPPILAALERWFDRPYPYEKLDLIAVPEFWPGAMENAGAITFSDAILLLDPATVTPKQRRSLVTSWRTRSRTSGSGTS
jgi:alanyl aminopeptidase